METERRDIKGRAAVVQRVIDGVVQNPSVTLTVTTMQQWLGVPDDAAERILDRLASSGLVREVQKGVECGILLQGYNEAQVGDILEAFEITYVEQEL